MAFHTGCLLRLCPLKIGFDISCKSCPCMKCQSLFSGKSNKNITSLLSAEFAHSVVKVIMVPLKWDESLLSKVE